MRLRLIMLLGLTACASAGPVPTRAPPTQALKAARARLVERGVRIDEAGERPDRVRTAFHCHSRDQDFEITFARSVEAPRPFTVTGSLDRQAREKARCPYRVRVEVSTQPAALIVDAEWWRVTDGRCKPVGNALLGEVICEYDWKSAAPPDDVRSHFSRMLQGL